MFTSFESETYWSYLERMLASQSETEVADWYECAIALLKQVQERQPSPYQPSANQQSA